MKLPQVPPDIFCITGKSHLFLSLLGFPIPPPKPGTATDVCPCNPFTYQRGCHEAIQKPNLPHNQIPTHGLGSNRRTGKSPLESHRALGHTMASCSPTAALLEPEAGCYQATREQSVLKRPHAYHNFKTRAGSPSCFSLTCPGSGTHMTCTACQCIF